MRDKIIKRNIIITFLSLILFYFGATFVSTRSNRQTIQENLINVSNIVISQLRDDPDNYQPIVDYFTSDSDWINAIVAKDDGSIVYDSTNDINYSYYNLKISDKDLEIINKNDVDRKRIYINNNNMYYCSRVNEQYLIITFIELDNNINYILNTFFYMLVLIAITLLLEILLSRKTNKIVTESFNTISNSLKTITTGDYKDIDTSSEYTEVRDALKEISKINKSIYKYINELSIEESKIVSIMDNMHQGLIILDGEHHVLLINNYTERHLGLKTNTEYELFDNIFKEEKILNKISELSIDNDIKIDYYDHNNDKIYLFLMSYIDSKWDEKSSDGMIFISILNVTIERKNEIAKEEFIANASHELKTPITSISGFSELLLTGLGETDDLAKKYIQRIYDESFRMQETINELLYLSNLDNSSSNIKLDEVIYLDEIVLDIIEVMDDFAKSAKVTLKTNCIPAKVLGNRILVEHLLTNLIQNGVKYNKENGEVLVEIKEDSDDFILAVKDTGIGIDEKSIDKIFDRFYRVDTSHSRKTGGTGLGLTIVKRIVDVLGATISVRSTINVGTTFEVRFSKIN